MFENCTFTLILCSILCLQMHATHSTVLYYYIFCSCNIIGEVLQCRYINFLFLFSLDVHHPHEGAVLEYPCTFGNIVMR